MYERMNERTNEWMNITTSERWFLSSLSYPYVRKHIMN